MCMHTQMYFVELTLFCTHARTHAHAHPLFLSCSLACSAYDGGKKENLTQPTLRSKKTAPECAQVAVSIVIAT